MKHYLLYLKMANPLMLLGLCGYSAFINKHNIKIVIKDY
jgi:hypothetical protein